jgi:hypothetical protein
MSGGGSTTTVDLATMAHAEDNDVATLDVEDHAPVADSNPILSQLRGCEIPSASGRIPFKIEQSRVNPSSGDRIEIGDVALRATGHQDPKAGVHCRNTSCTGFTRPARRSARASRMLAK